MSCAKQPARPEVLTREELLVLVGRLAESLNRFGRHESRCRFGRHGHLECTCGLHARILEGGGRP